jgi:SAM-dependent methyltransferase
MDVKEEAILGNALDDHWYYRSKGRALLRMLSGIPFLKVMDIGAGSGIFSKLLLRNGASSATCVDPAYPTAMRDQPYAGKVIHFRRKPDGEKADLVLLMDVLEHVDDDLGLLNEAVHNSAEKAYILITVPAFEFLFSAHDRFLEHKRRYTLRQVEDLVKSAGLEVISGCYFFGMLFPLVAALRFREKNAAPKSNLRIHSRFVNGILKIAHWFEVAFFKLNRFAGLTVFCLARKP